LLPQRLSTAKFSRRLHIKIVEGRIMAGFQKGKDMEKAKTPIVKSALSEVVEILAAGIVRLKRKGKQK